MSLCSLLVILSFSSVYVDDACVKFPFLVEMGETYLLQIVNFGEKTVNPNLGFSHFVFI